MTNISNIIRQTIKEVIIECHDDLLGLWAIIASLKIKGIKADALELRKITIKVVNALLDEKDIVAFNYRKPNYHIWNIPKEQIIARIEKEWDELGKEPSLGNIVWFTSKEISRRL